MGAQWDAGYWRSKLSVNGTLHYLGTFDSEEEAHDEYVAASLHYRGYVHPPVINRWSAKRQPFFDPKVQAWRIPLADGQHALCDSEDVQYLTQWCWQTRKGLARREVRGIPGGHLLMHRVVAERAGQSLEGLTKHVDGNRLNNRRSNLRAVPWEENFKRKAKADPKTPPQSGDPT